MPCGSEMPATTVSLRNFAAAGIWLASVAGVMPSFKGSSAKEAVENATMPLSNAIFSARVKCVGFVVKRFSNLAKIAPSSSRCMKFTNHDER